MKTLLMTLFMKTLFMNDTAVQEDTETNMQTNHAQHTDFANTLVLLSWFAETTVCTSLLRLPPRPQEQLVNIQKMHLVVNFCAHAHGDR